MRGLIFFCLCLISVNLISQVVDREICLALDNLSNGYILWGYEELKKTASTNDIAAQYYIAACNEVGIGVEKNLSEAFLMYRRAAERGLPDAMYQIARFYRDGIVVSKDANREKEWMQRFNQKGGKLLLPDLVQIYNEGIKHPENYALNPNNDNSNLLAQNAGYNTQKSVVHNITVVQQAPVQINNVPQEAEDQTSAGVAKSDVDQNIPSNQLNQDNTFALIIANENYQDVENVPNALNDGAIFVEYCEKTLGLPNSNIRYVADATLNNIIRQLNWISQVMEAYGGEASVIFYYAGHGIPDENNRASYLLPVDGFGTDVSTGYSLDKLYAELSSKPAKSVTVFLDACFSGAKRDGGMLASARGVAIKAKQNEPKGNMVVLSAAQGDETAYPYEEKGHGLFTYYLLKKLQETKGDVTLGELADYVTSEVKKRSVVVNGKMQTPLASASSSATDWRNWKLR